MYYGENEYILFIAWNSILHRVYRVYYVLYNNFIILCIYILGKRSPFRSDFRLFKCIATLV